jgi:predicted transcriptional regulator
MGVVWTHPGEVSVGDVHAALPGGTQGAYTTIKTTMERLADKGILTRARPGKAYLYRAAVSQEELERRIVSSALDRLVEQFPAAVASFFVRPDPGISHDQLALLEEAIQRRRQGKPHG